MLQNFIICVNAVIPSAIYLLIGILLKTAGVVSDEDVKKFTRVVFVTLYPFIMFDNLYGKNIGENFDLLLVVYCVVFTCLQIAITWFAVSRLVKEDRNKGTMIQSAFRSNIILMGLPVGIYRCRIPCKFQKSHHVPHLGKPGIKGVHHQGLCDG